MDDFKNVVLQEKPIASKNTRYSARRMVQITVHALTTLQTQTQMKFSYCCCVILRCINIHAKSRIAVEMNAYFVPT